MTDSKAQLGVRGSPGAVDADGPTADVDADVAVIGCGPVGMTLAALLGKAGHSVVVLERHPGLYGLPRAASLDGETMRTLQGLGLVDELAPNMRAQDAYEWRNGTGDLLIRQEFRDVGASGWADLYLFHQPSLEKALHSLCASLPDVDIRLGSEVTGLAQDRDRVTLDLADGASLAARYAVGCDGGNSFVRGALGIEQDDLGFSEPWLVHDFALRRPAAELGLPSMLQIGDPEEPTTIITTAAGHQRFCFLLDGDEDDEDDDDDDDEGDHDDFQLARAADRVWSRVGRYLSRDDADIVRTATYTFQSLVARQWRVGRVLLAGDAAHQMPPFLGQGLCSGIRDARNIAFKVDLVLRGVQGAEVLDTYQSEREPHVRGVTATSMQLGRQHTLRDPVLARERDVTLMARRAALQEPERIRLPDLGPGLLAFGGGRLSVQGRVSDGRRTGLLDEVVGGGFRLLVVERALPQLSPALLASLGEVGVTVVGLGPSAAGAVLADLDGTHRRWLSDIGATAAAVRPDNYVYAAGPDAGAVADRLLTALAPDLCA
ncbi:bifunctional 3-(3-hydroxy-phenyl)propionate/3-hydroxycinnamic acid hydroxylase [Streptomyces atriruber]|uniref:Bifunctional 3-(3-hydroxy-phenyl)propionate/3-hydroxycinnamic acid hydroxylase n=1 Tax=Streptomyces atriruber TaxID=545121 RepID=A0ABV3BIN7_9ACTN